ncbi:hypothetical protein [Pyxidicoccus xibeiensis]|uniref:hypothetical protein n=1 Tax=Pyxidicoccus xibeiensis TaxID=2906759 RepID=UPI0020A7B93E|nr:hypothetical protein [Pyxidicoccus xibeiensis]MCP3141561.1 hypothetical protein [Pyxidicoccus xibeiensis]
MRVLTASLLVEAVTELSKGSPLVKARDVFAWCDRNLVNYQGEGLRHQALWDADLEEARGQQRLLKFKSGECKQSRVGWALIAKGSRAREAAARLGWQEQLWNGESWTWLQTPMPGVAPVVNVRRVGAEAA